MTEEELKEGSSLPYNLLRKKYVLAYRIFFMGPGRGNAVTLASIDLTTSGHFKKKKMLLSGQSIFFQLIT